MRKNNICIFDSGPIAIFTDLHLGVNQNAAQWLDYSVQFIEWMVNELKNRKIKNIVFSGDWFHDRSEVKTNVLDTSAKILDLLDGFNIVMIAGNHDCYYKQSSKVNSISILERRNIFVVDNDTITSTSWQGNVLQFIPWGFNIEDLSESDVIFGHFDIFGFPLDNNQTCSHGLDVKQLLNKSSLVFSGHFHKPSSRTFDNGKVIYIGNPFDTNYRESGDKGFYILDKSLNYDKIICNFLPKFFKVKLTDLCKDEVFKNIKSLTNNYIKLIIDCKINDKILNDIVVFLRAVINVKELQLDFDFNEQFGSVGNMPVQNGIDMVQNISRYIDNLDINNKEIIKKFILQIYNKCV